jgi:hypothetical protein
MAEKAYNYNSTIDPILRVVSKVTTVTSLNDPLVSNNFHNDRVDRIRAKANHNRKLVAVSVLAVSVCFKKNTTTTSTC